MLYILQLNMKLKSIFIRKRRKNESLFKYISAIIHLWLGLFSSVVVMIVCITGCIYAFKNEINNYFNRSHLYVKVEKQALPIDFFENKFKENNLEIASITLPNSPKRSIVISTIDPKTQLIQTNYFNPYTGEKLNYNKTKDLSKFFRTIENLHKNLLLGEIGKQIVGAFVIIFIICLLSGLILWWPKRNKKQIKQAFTIKWKSKFYRVNYDLHNTIGFYSLIFLLFISITGIYITYPWIKNAVLISLGGQSISQQTQLPEDGVTDSFAALMDEMIKKEEEIEKNEIKDTISLSEILKVSNQILPYNGTTSITLPNENEAWIRIQKTNTNNWLGMILTDYIDLDRKGNLKKSELFKDKPLHQQFQELSKPLHTGEIMGTSSVVFYFIITFIGFTLPITGFIIWWKKARRAIQ